MKRLSILSVMANPPTTLKVAVMMAREPNIFSTILVGWENRTTAPSIVTAEMALVIDIKGVCKSGGTLEINR